MKGVRTIIILVVAMVSSGIKAYHLSHVMNDDAVTRMDGSVPTTRFGQTAYSSSEDRAGKHRRGANHKPLSSGVQQNPFLDRETHSPGGIR